MKTPLEEHYEEAIDYEKSERRATAILIVWMILIVAALFGAVYAYACGEERWAVKTEADADASKIEFTPATATVAHLAHMQAPTRAELDAKPENRFPEELKTYSIEGYLVGFKLEADDDFHIVLADPNDPKVTMIIEMPSEDCMPPRLRNEAAVLRASWEARFGKATRKFKNVEKHKIKVQVTGVGFFDFIHGQTGVAESGFELHPVLSWKDIR